jgi:hypothetical protein
MGCAINEKHGIFDIVFLPKLSKEYFGKIGCCGRKQPKLKQFVRVRISSSVQPVLLIVDANYGLVDRNLIRSFATGRL